MNTFANILDELIKKSDCSAAALAKESGISASGLSRYRSGGRTPDKEIIVKLSEVLSSHGAGQSEDIQSKLFEVLDDNGPRFPQLGSRLSELIDRFGINVNKLAKYMEFDASFISRVRKGERYPSKDESFIKSVAEYIVDNPTANFDMSYEDVISYLKLDSSPSEDLILSFINEIKLEDDYVGSYSFTGKAPIRGNTKSYSEPNGLSNALTDFTNSLFISRTKNDLYIFSDIPCDLKNIVRVAISKGVTTHIIFDTSSTLTKIVSDLKEWIPLLKNPLVKSYYIPNHSSCIFNHVLVSSGVFSLFGECIFGTSEKGTYTVSGTKDDVLQIRRYAKQIFAKAKPLINIQDNGQLEIFHPTLSHLFKSHLESEA